MADQSTGIDVEAQQQLLRGLTPRQGTTTTRLVQLFEPNGNFVYWRSLQTCSANTDQISTGRQIRMHTGSTSGKSIAQSQRTSKKAKRVDIQFLYTQQLTRDGIISIHKINATNNTADFSQSTSLEGSFSVCNTLQVCTRAL